MSSKLTSLEQGVVVLIRQVNLKFEKLLDKTVFLHLETELNLSLCQILGDTGLLLEVPEETSDHIVSSNMLEAVRRDYSVLYCFRKDAHKIETFLKLLKCRQIDKENCSFF